MVFKYKRKTNQASWSESSLQKAILEVREDKKSINATAKKYGIPYGTLYRHLKSGSHIKKLGRFTPIFTCDQEQELCEYLQKLDSLFFGLIRKDFLELVYVFAEKNNINHRFKNGRAGDDWFAGFKVRHPEIVLRSPEPTSLARTRGFNKPQVELFYANYWSEVEKHNFDPTTIYNMDETGVRMTTSKPPKVLSVKGKKQVGVIGSAERGQLTTVICCCNAAGTFIPPFFIFARKRMQERLLDGSPPGSQATVSDNGWINGPVFLNWLQYFVEKTRPTKDRKVLLLIDNHESHKYYPALEYATKNNVVFVSFAPHTTNRMQPLDVAVYGPLKKYFEQELNIFQKSHPGRIINQYDIARIFSGAYVKSASVHNAIQGFRKPGIWSYNPHVFSDEDYMPSTMTDRPLNSEISASSCPGQVESNRTPSPSIFQSISSESLIALLATQAREVTPEPAIEEDCLMNVEIITPSYLEKDNVSQSATEYDASHSSHTNMPSICTPGPSSMTEHTHQVISTSIQSDLQEMSNSSSATVTISPYTIRPIPTMAASKTNKKRRCQKSMVLTSTPVKNEQAIKYKKIYNKKTKISDLDVKKKGKGKENMIARGKVKTKKKIHNITKKVKGKYSCLVCTEEYIDPPIEDWIQCLECHRWAHENCTLYSGLASYFCDDCQE